MSGFTLPSREDKPAYVEAMFDKIAHGYDAANDWMTGGLHHGWKRRLIRLVGAKPGDHALDLATGTGDIARRLASAVGPTGHVTGLDFSAGMLERARAIEGGAGIHWVKGDMMALPVENAAMDVVTVGFGLRNVADVDRALAEIARVLKPGGRFGSLEMARPWLWLRPGVWLFNTLMVPLIGRLASGDADPYRYLHASSEAFMDQHTLAERCRQAGFQDVRVRDLLGGTLALVTGTR
jgi:demethylmenaquinone methyltransferase / 2-methoxy-6-polyprenyl-1,4-benzoquinol methylase